MFLKDVIKIIYGLISEQNKIGIIWPVEGMPAWVRFITNFSPLTHSAEAIRSVASRGKTPLKIMKIKICFESNF